jgi:hypothetical protein
MRPGWTGKMRARPGAYARAHRDAVSRQASGGSLPVRQALVAPSYLRVPDCRINAVKEHDGVITCCIWDSMGQSCARRQLNLDSRENEMSMEGIWQRKSDDELLIACGQRTGDVRALVLRVRVGAPTGGPDPIQWTGSLC